MKKTLAIIALCTISAAAVAAGMNADPAAGSAPPTAQERGPRVDRMAERLGLSEQQTAQVQAIFDQLKQEREALRQETHDRLAGVLTAAQMEKLEQHRHFRGKEHCERSEHHRPRW